MTYLCRTFTRSNEIVASDPLALAGGSSPSGPASVWARLGDLSLRVASAALTGVAALVETVKTLYAGDPDLRRRVAFSVAMIALSAKMAKSDGVVTQNEVQAFYEMFEVPRTEARNVSRLYELAKQDTAGFEVYAERLAGLCGSGRPNCAMLEDILDGLFHIARADGIVHEREVAFLRRVAEIFGIDETRFERILLRHAHTGPGDPYAVLGVSRDEPFDSVKARYRTLVLENHPDRLIARGVPPEFLAIATSRLAAINAAYESIERGLKPA